MILRCENEIKIGLTRSIIQNTKYMSYVREQVIKDAFLVIFNQSDSPPFHMCGDFSTSRRKR
jgi:hypothetical protein